MWSHFPLSTLKLNKTMFRVLLQLRLCSKFDGLLLNVLINQGLKAREIGLQSIGPQCALQRLKVSVTRVKLNNILLLLPLLDHHLTPSQGLKTY